MILRIHRMILTQVLEIREILFPTYISVNRDIDKIVRIKLNDCVSINNSSKLILHHLHLYLYISIYFYNISIYNQLIIQFSYR